jgi:hypothetical protein
MVLDKDLQGMDPAKAAAIDRGEAKTVSRVPVNVRPIKNWPLSSVITTPDYHIATGNKEPVDLGARPWLFVDADQKELKIKADHPRLSRDVKHGIAITISQLQNQEASIGTLKVQGPGGVTVYGPVSDYELNNKKDNRLFVNVGKMPITLTGSNQKTDLVFDRAALGNNFARHNNINV